jgi:hypothetical protein
MYARPNAQHSQIAYVTNDLERAMALFQTDFGTPGFLQFSNTDNPPANWGGEVLKIALAKVGGVEIELIEPEGDTAPLFSDPLPKDGSFAIVFHHVANRIDGPIENWHAHLASLDTAKHPIVFQGSLPGMLEYAYTDTRTSLGHCVEHVWMGPEILAQMGGMVPTYPG